MSSTKIQQPDHAGLQRVPADAPEVAHNQTASSNLRSSSMSRPEVHTPNIYSQNEKPDYEYYDGPPDDTADTYYAQDAREHDRTNAPSDQRTICGLRRAVFFWILTAVIIVIVIAVVLGGVLGTVLNNSSGSTIKQ